MRRRRLLLGAGLLALVAAAGLAPFLCLTTPKSGPTLENFRRVRVGMTAKQAESILAPAGARGRSPEGGDLSWHQPEFSIWIWFDTSTWVEEDDRVVRGEFEQWRNGAKGNLGEGPLDRLRRLLPW